MDNHTAGGEVAQQREPGPCLGAADRFRWRPQARRQRRQHRPANPDLLHPARLRQRPQILDRGLPVRAQPPVDLDPAVVEPAGGGDGGAHPPVVLDHHMQRPVMRHASGSCNPFHRPGGSSRFAAGGALHRPRPLVQPLRPERLLRVRLVVGRGSRRPGSPCSCSRDQPLPLRRPVRRRQPPRLHIVDPAAPGPPTTRSADRRRRSRAPPTPPSAAAASTPPTAGAPSRSATAAAAPARPSSAPTTRRRSPPSPSTPHRPPPTTRCGRRRPPSPASSTATGRAPTRSPPARSPAGLCTPAPCSCAHHIAGRCTSRQTARSLPVCTHVLRLAEPVASDASATDTSSRSSHDFPTCRATVSTAASHTSRPSASVSSSRVATSFCHHRNGLPSRPSAHAMNSAAQRRPSPRVRHRHEPRPHRLRRHLQQPLQPRHPPPAVALTPARPAPAATQPHRRRTFGGAPVTRPHAPAPCSRADHPCGRDPTAAPERSTDRTSHT